MAIGAVRAIEVGVDMMACCAMRFQWINIRRERSRPGSVSMCEPDDLL